MKRKKLVLFLTSIVLVIGVIVSSITPFMVKAATINYAPFEYLISVDDIDDTNQYNATICGAINQGVLSPYNEVIYVYSDSQHVLNVGDFYLCKLVYDTLNIYLLDVNYYIKFDDYIQMGFDSYYSNGYSSGVSTTDYDSAYNSGYSYGQQDMNTYWENKHADTQSYYQNELRTQQEYYSSQLQSEYNRGKDDGILIGEQRANEEMLGDDIEQATVGFKFTNLLNTIFMYPVRVFKEAFDVELFGINVGGVLLTIMAISLISLIVFAIKRVFK